ncbi:MAG: T9SS type A sorting domain-containing protein [Flavobacteriaceae bacterium]|jgi:hypothetical protein|nr:T9SS type A sorting domain-containing protein [Flavobacteriaceae bacterium]
MKKLYTFLLSIITATAVNAQANIITEWNFNDQTTNPQTGSGGVSLLGGITEWDSPSDGIPAGFSSGCNPETLQLEDGLATGNWAYNTTSYSAQGTASGTAGIQFVTSTIGHFDVSFIFNLRRSSTGSTYFAVYSSTNGTDWEEVAVESNTTTDYAAYGGPYLLPNGSDAEQLYIKVVTVFAPGTNSYAATAGSGYGTGGTVRFDNVRVFTGNLSVNEAETQPVVSTTVWNREVTFSTPEKTNVELYNLTGQKIKSFVVNGTDTVNVNDLATGVYLLKFTNGTRTVTQKVVKK